MAERERTEPIRLYLDDDDEPFRVASAPLTFHFNTIALPDGRHTLRIEASNGLAPPTVREIPFVVRNGVALTVSGLEAEQTIAGQVQMVINAYAGNTEVDFEPRRAETPQPIPTWAWVVLLAVVAWTMYYLINPQVKSSASESASHLPTPLVGARIFADTCARCHGEAGTGNAPQVPPLRDAPIALEESAAPLLILVTASRAPRMGPDARARMPDWGTRLTNEEIVSVVNHVRSSWGHDGSQIQLRFRNPPDGIDELHKRFSRALKQKRLGDLMLCCGEEGKITPQIFRTDGVDQRGAVDVERAWASYFDALTEADARVTQLSLPDARYDYDPATIDQDGSIVIATGRIFLETRNKAGESRTAKGRFIRVYERQPTHWTLAFDFADIPMAVGCVPGTVICPTDGMASPSSPASGTEGERPAATPPAVAAGTPSPIGYEDVQAILSGLGRGARSAPHGSFWTKPYDDFIGFEFAEEIGEPGRVRLLVRGDSASSNLMKVLRGEKGIVVHLPGGATKIRDDIERMPPGGRFVSDEDIAKIAAWIDAGCPEFEGDYLPVEKAAEAQPAGSDPSGAPVDPFDPGSFPPPAPEEPQAPGGFPPPAPEQPQAPGGFPPPAPEEPQAPGGFPPPAPEEPQAPGGFPPPAPPPDEAPVKKPQPRMPRVPDGLPPTGR